MKTVLELGLAAKEAAKTVKTASTKEKNLALSCIAEALLKNMDDILKANEQDLVTARAAGMKKKSVSRPLLRSGLIPRLMAWALVTIRLLCAWRKILVNLTTSTLSDSITSLSTLPAPTLGS